MIEVLFLRLLRYYLVLFQATQILSYAYVPQMSYAIISTGTFSSPSQATLTFQDMLKFLKIRLRSKLYSYSATLTFQVLLTFLQLKLRYNNKRPYAFNPKCSYVYIPKYPATLTFQDMLKFQKICLRSKRYAYVPKNMVTFQKICLRYKLNSFSATLNPRYN